MPTALAPGSATARAEMSEGTATCTAAGSNFGIRASAVKLSLGRTRDRRYRRRVISGGAAGGRRGKTMVVGRRAGVRLGAVLVAVGAIGTAWVGPAGAPAHAAGTPGYGLSIEHSNGAG